ncbi:MAG: IclR family transcriptional regulator [Actinomycetota bacterium]|nr:IclR family transcriptional regulator [Actinomycetota bacterium]
MSAVDPVDVSPTDVVYKPSNPRAGTVRSIERAFDLLETMADHGGTMGLSQLATASGLPLPTIHRLLRTLVDLGYLRQDASRQYVLAPRLIRLGESSAAMLGVWAKPHLDRLVKELGESANLAMLDGDEIVYVAQAQSHQSMRMFTEVGRRVLPHCTAVGKALMARMPQDVVADVLRRTGMPEHTEHTITNPGAFAQALRWVNEHGYAVDDEEQEHGVRCVAVAVPDAPGQLGLSVSGPASRMTESTIERAVPLLQSAAQDLSHDLA